MKYTENMELLLYDANDIMNTNDFVNQNNQKIDAYVAGVKATAEEANAGQQTANNGLSEVNGKVNTINQQLTDGELVTLPQFKTDTEDRLEELENTVNLTLKPEYGNWISVANNMPNYSYIDTIIGLYITTDTINLQGNVSNNMVCRYWASGTVNTYNYKKDVVKRAGNYFNIDLNVIYTTSMPIRDMDASGDKYAFVAVGVYYNGVDTIFCILSNSPYQTQMRLNFGGWQSIFGKSGPNKPNV